MECDSLADLIPFLNICPDPKQTEHNVGGYSWAGGQLHYCGEPIDCFGDNLTREFPASA